MTIKLQNEVEFKKIQLTNVMETNNTQKKLIDELTEELNCMRSHSLVGVKCERHDNKFGTGKDIGRG